MPFHLGHKALIDFALRKCDYLTVLVCCSNKEELKAETRVNWIKETYSAIPNIEILALNYDENLLPNTSVSSRDVSKIWAAKFKSIIPEVNLVFTSEDYGDLLAGFMQIKHIIFDKKRNAVPVSATVIRQSFYDNWDFLPKAVKETYQKKIVFLGTESTGKSSLSKAISSYFDSTLVEEVGREIIPDATCFTIDDLRKVATEHAANINKACRGLKPFVFIDTDIYITQSYAKYQFGKYLDVDKGIYDMNRADMYFYLHKDLQFSQDGTRLAEENRNALDTFHQKTLEKFEVDYIDVEGTWDDRLDKIKSVIKREFNIR